ncbi:uncharacterized protein LOC128724313 [Anopheles nili]|uniref:uncharacterized protein LOC128724313 n=1 Tax=Anopheles nili TaxID=185578 RepID=UPI00237BE060|nr:uncharacterized protein LOC128724313 [Anopheles nili]
MSNAAFLEDWNSVVPFKIKGADLEKPTEQFVYKAILNIFRLIHYDVSSYEGMYSESTETLIVKRVEFVARINYIYQLCSDSKQTSFFYVDLVKPTTKKIIHLLKILLNYLFYINMVKETILEKANSCTEKYFDLNAKLNQEQIAKEENKIRVSNLNRHIDDLKHQLPHLKEQVDILQQQKHTIEEKISKLKTSDQELMDKIVELKLEHTELTDRIVPIEEAVELKDSKNSLEHELELLTDNEQELQKTYKIHVTSINEMKPCIALLEKMLQYEYDDICKFPHNELSELKVQCEKMRKDHANLESVFNTLLENEHAVEIELEEKQRELAAHNIGANKIEDKNDSQVKYKEKYLTALVETNDTLVEILQALQRDVQRIIHMCEKALKIVDTTFIE